MWLVLVLLSSRLSKLDFYLFCGHASTLADVLKLRQLNDLVFLLCLKHSFYHRCFLGRVVDSVAVCNIAVHTRERGIDIC